MSTPLLDESGRVAPRVDWRESSPSTNAELVAAAVADPDAWPDFSVIVTDAQTAGRGRLGRPWTAPPGSALAISVLLRPGVPIDRLGWIPLIGGLAMTRTVRWLLADAGMRAADAALKWPNDVLVHGLKVCGVLSELVTDLSVVVGAGLNTGMTREQLPVETATSLAIECRRTYSVDEVLARYLRELRGLYERFTHAGGDARSSGILADVSAACDTLGRRVRVQLPGDTVLEGVARGIDADGRLNVQADGRAQLTSISAGDVTHVRLA
ncbi:BirA family transcriptional regulator, biotin operon repressor / biotin-[acetyl-CoA-carboxylase] ligase [Paramicrobacterium humi]|uniref:biotin--[biotin carboxyl-carrier protein] ligase n=1 Tax=Paramicrobacterium humi TaxID=640635 RepID=A0A1H4IVF2_9MICO|nr:biotin--[acetyl-CoA-carboxylase] ligase [Microbacterium humi]SEB37202.1 BirA family transcriptional regulator, biotin operon repressor / biotin-[acetyl-CoA-carboxylase] ligase [Microbacterium humi]